MFVLFGYLTRSLPNTLNIFKFNNELKVKLTILLMLELKTMAINKLQSLVSSKTPS